jgi:1,4-alpha-glucan branching enzyme
VVGDFNDWNGQSNPLSPVDGTGIWQGYARGVGEGARYKYRVIDGHGRELPLKSDPVAFGAEHPPQTASIVRDIASYGWRDAQWMSERGSRNHHRAPISIYEVHLGSWRRRSAEDNRMLSYREAAVELVDYVADMGFTHIEFLPLNEHPFDGSWGYQPVGLFAPTIRHGPPQEFRDLIDAAHRRGLGVILDWVPAHFPADEHGLARFDGTALYEHEDPRQGFHQDWNTLIYNYGRREVANFLISNALFWIEEFHLDGLRVDAVASMLYLDYSRRDGEWVPNRHGGRENLEAIDLLRRVNTLTYGEMPGTMTIAEESTTFPGVSRPVHEGGLGFGFKWNMGWMNDTLSYIGLDPIHRRHHHGKLTFGLLYAFNENFVLPISHDEVVHGKGSMFERMPGASAEDKFSNLRVYYGFMWGHPGKKLLFMGCEFAQPGEWAQSGQLDWPAAEEPGHAGIARLVRDLNRLYREQPALHALDCEAEGFTWLDADDADHSIVAWLRRSGTEDPEIAVVCNFTPVERRNWRVGLPSPGLWREVLNTDAATYGGGDRVNGDGFVADGPAHNGQPCSAQLTLAPLSALFLLAPDRAGD